MTGTGEGVFESTELGALHHLTSANVEWHRRVSAVWLCCPLVVCKDFILPMMMQLTGWNE